MSRFVATPISVDLDRGNLLAKLSSGHMCPLYFADKTFLSVLDSLELAFESPEIIAMQLALLKPPMVFEWEHQPKANHYRVKLVGLPTSRVRQRK